MIKNVGIIGRGALGIMYAKAFIEALGFENVFIIVDEDRYVRYGKEKLFYNNEPISLNYKKANEIKNLDLIIFTVKYPGLQDAIALAKQAVSSNTIIMSFLNGVVSEREIAQQIETSHLLYTTVQGMDATFLDHNLSVSHKGYVSYGSADNNHDEDIKAVADLFDKASIKYEISSDIKHQLFSKWMLNVGVNQACAYYGVGYAGIQKEGEPRQAMYRAMKEAQAAAKFCGVTLTDAEITKWIELMDSLDPNGAPSMEQDRRANRVNEVGLFAKSVCELGAQAKIPTPQNRIFLEKLSKKN